jgi:hypothetical protein
MCVLCFLKANCHLILPNKYECFPISFYCGLIINAIAFLSLHTGHYHLRLHYVLVAMSNVVLTIMNAIFIKDGELDDDCKFQLLFALATPWVFGFVELAEIVACSCWLVLLACWLLTWKVNRDKIAMNNGLIRALEEIARKVAKSANETEDESNPIAEDAQQEEVQ